MSHVFDKLLDARGLNCPMPLVNARKEIGKLELGQVLKVATDRGSLADFQGWAKVAKNMELVGQETESAEGANVYVHYGAPGKTWCFQRVKFPPRQEVQPPHRESSGA